MTNWIVSGIPGFNRSVTRFYRDHEGVKMTLIMSVSGVRGIVGQTMTPRLAADLGAAFGTFVGGGTVVIGRA